MKNILWFLLALASPAAADSLSEAERTAKATLDGCLAVQGARYAALDRCLGITQKACVENSATTDALPLTRAVRCYEEEAALWQISLDEFYAALVTQVTCTDPTRREQGYPAAMPSLVSAHEAWLAYMKGKPDLPYVSDQYGMGTLRIDDPVRYHRDQIAERALLYREWLTHTEWICPTK